MDEKYFVGFSTIGDSVDRSWVLYDIDLINQDLLNHFHTRLGERLMRPTYGCGIWDMIFDQLTDDVVSECDAEIRRIIGLDIRVTLQSLSISKFPNGIVANTVLYYKKQDIVDNFRIVFENRQS